MRLFVLWVVACRVDGSLVGSFTGCWPGGHIGCMLVWFMAGGTYLSAPLHRVTDKGHLRHLRVAEPVVMIGGWAAVVAHCSTLLCAFPPPHAPLLVHKRVGQSHI
eukprot:9485534-Pyramimonas_sp.AAC.2